MVTAMAVFVVSTTCTSVGCLLPVVMGETPTPQMACCLSHTKKSAPSHSESDNGKPKHCPTCDQPLSVGEIQKAAALKIDFSPCFGAPVISPIAQFIPALRSPELSFASPPIGPPTLLDLHCSLLT
jgi:hypothetical protein